MSVVIECKVSDVYTCPGIAHFWSGKRKDFFVQFVLHQMKRHYTWSVGLLLLLLDQEILGSSRWRVNALFLGGILEKPPAGRYVVFGKIAVSAENIERVRQAAEASPRRSAVRHARAQMSIFWCAVSRT